MKNKIILLVTIILCSASFLQAQKVTLNYQQAKLSLVLTKITEQTGLTFTYSLPAVDPSRLVNIQVTDAELPDALSQLFRGTDIRFEISKEKIYLMQASSLVSESLAEQKRHKVSGKVLDNQQEPIIGANVIVRGTNIGIMTDLDGNFTLEVPEKSTLQISYVGFLPQEISIGNKSNFNIILKEDQQALDEVVVVGYGSVRKKDVTGAITRLDITEKETIPNINPVQALRGSVAGVRIIDTGKAGADGSIQVRGTTSITASNEPLIVLDGVPYTGGRLSDINTNDIETMDILKDASSTAIYGSRGANGVIIITTKKGIHSKPTLNYSGYIGFSDFANMPELMNGEQYQQLRKDAEVYMNQALPFQTIEEENMAAGRTIDPWEVIKQDAPMTSHELSVSGKNKDVNYFLSTSYTSQKSALAGDQFRRITVRTNFDLNITDWLQIGTNSSFSTKDYSGNDAQWGNAGYLSPYSSIRYDDGSLRYLPFGDGMVTNPLWDVEMKQNKEVSYGIFNTNFAIIKLPLDGLTYQMNLANNLRFKDVNKFTPSYDRDGYSWLASGSKNHQKSYNLIFENILKYSHVLAKVHNVDATIMYGYELSKDEASTLSSNNIFSDLLGYNGLGIGENQTVATTAIESAAISSMARLGYRYSSRYMLTLTVRRDGYSAFGNDRKYGTFPSVGLGWAISEEEFMSKVSALDFLKLRLSWGKNGNRGIDSYESLSTMDLARYVFGDGGSTSIGLYPTSMANPLLSWEASQSYNAGIDFSLFGNRLTGAIDLYHTKTENLLLSVSIPNISGYGSFTTNIGETENKGLEISLTSENIKTEDLRWLTILNFSTNKNKILHLSGQDLDGDGKEDDDIGKKRFIGYSMGSNFDYVFDGIWQEGDDFSIDPSAKPGDLKFKDVDGNGSIGPEDRVVLSNNRPKYILSMNNIVRYKGFTFSILFDYRNGGYASNNWINPGTSFYNRCNQLDLPYWTPENQLTDRPSVGYSNPRGYGFYEKLSYLRLQDVSLSYDLPKALLNKIAISNVKAYISGKNLATWTDWHGWDPEHAAGGRASSNGPLIRSWVFGVQFSL